MFHLIQTLSKDFEKNITISSKNDTWGKYSSLADVFFKVNSLWVQYAICAVIYSPLKRSLHLSSLSVKWTYLSHRYVMTMNNQPNGNGAISKM